MFENDLDLIDKFELELLSFSICQGAQTWPYSPPRIELLAEIVNSFNNSHHVTSDLDGGYI